MLAEIGIVSLFAALVATFFSIGLALIAAFVDSSRKSQIVSAARNAMLLTLPLLAIPAGILIYAQVNGHYEISYVNSVSKDAQPLALQITALWGGQAGSLILWSLMLSGFIVAAILLNWKSEHHLMPWVMVVAGATLGFFLVLNVFYENAFLRTWWMPDGNIEESLFQPDDEAKLAYPYTVRTWQMRDGSQVEQLFQPAGAIEISQRQTFWHEPEVRSQVTGEVATPDGRGLNPLLRHPGMIIHPPMLYLGFTGFMIPFAFAIAALISGSLGSGWIKATRRWSLIAWVFLSLGLILGGRWAYDVLGWGGYWGWDPVENSSFLPWLTGTAFLHSVMIQERRGMLKGWNMFMIILTYLLVMFGTVATRTGLWSSVHSFAQSPLSVPMGLFLGTTIVVTLGLFLWRGSQGKFENDHELESMFSRESLFLFNNWVFLALTVVVFWGTWAELITGFAQDFGLIENTITLGQEYYMMIVPWLFLVLFILMGVAPLAAWRRASAKKLGISLQVPLALGAVVFILLFFAHGANSIAVEFGYAAAAFAGFATLQEIWKGMEARHRAHGEAWHIALWRLFRRNQRRYGGYMIHLGVVVLGIGIIASTAFQEVRNVSLNPGETADIGPYTVRFERVFEANAIDDRAMLIADVTLFKNGEEVNQLRPRRDFFGGNSSPMSIAGTHATVENDVYALITHWEGQTVTFRLYRNPLISFVWWGGLLFVIGTIIAVYPEPKKQTEARMQTVRATARPVAAGD